MYSPKKQINLDITNKCALACPACDRQSLIRNKQRIDGKDISVESFRKIVDYFDHLIFCGQVSDPTHHDNFKDLLKLCVVTNKRVTVNVASTIRDIGWFTRCFLLSKGRNIEWIFGIDGLPKDSHKYRINQDGEKLFDIMKIGKQLGCQVVWKYIVFNYNEDSIEEAYRLANSINVRLDIIKSVRWEDDMVKYKPSKEENYITRPFERSKYS